MDPARRGKVASLPAAIRTELNRRLHDGQRGPKILPWINSLPEVLQVLDDQWGEEPITASNLSDWRTGGYQDYLRQIEAIQRTQALSEYCRKIGEAGGSAMGLPAAIAGGQLMDVLERFDVGVLNELLAAKPANYILLLSTLAGLQRSKVAEKTAEQNETRLKQNEEKLAQSERLLRLAEEKFKRETAALFLKWRSDERAKEIADSSAPKEVKMEKLVKLLFGNAPGTEEEDAEA